MKMPRPLLLTVLLSLLLLYVSGTLTWIMTHWFLNQSGFGLEPSPLKTLWLQLHSVTGLWFMVLFGFLFHSHVRPGWRRGRKLGSGGLTTGVLIFLMLTVPLLFYLSNESAKSWVVWSHTYVGLALVVPFLWHYFSA